jgi:hypothetical protein
MGLHHIMKLLESNECLMINIQCVVIQGGQNLCTLSECGC